MKRTSTLVPGAVLVFAALAACGGGGGSGGATDTQTPTSPAAPTSSTASTSASVAPTSQPATGTSASEATSSSEAPSAKPVIVIESFSYKMPESVQAGETITVRNKDKTAHTVTADNGKFDVNVPAFSEVTFTAPKQAGSYGIFCTFHPYMTSTLEVT